MRYLLRDYVEKLIEEDLVRAYDLNGMGDTSIGLVTYDSRKTGKNGIFICKGNAFRAEYLREALNGGCICYIAEKQYETEKASAWIEVTDIRRAMPVLAEMFYNTSEHQVRLTAITGTKGKTTTAYYLKAILDAWERKKGGRETGFSTSIETYDGKERRPSLLTTPEALELHEHIWNAEEQGLSFFTMEVSSQALKYHRVRRLDYEVGVFLNISEDHISPAEHESFEDYFSSKLSMFRQVRTACVNLDSDYSERIRKAARLAGKVITFGTKGNPDIWGHDVTVHKDKISFRVYCDRFHEKFSLRMHGLFNVENALAAIAAAYAYEVPVECMQEGLADVQVEGRMEEFESRNRKLVAIVDYAHNRLSFEKLFDSVFKEYPDYRVVTVFGCPGDKAFNRRRDLGLVAGLFSDQVYLTTDDPGTESVAKIAGEISRYVEMVGCPCTTIEDRTLAIRKAVECAAGKTVVLVLGKGNEGRQRFGQTICECPKDAEVVRKSILQYDKNCMRTVAMGSF